MKDRKISYIALLFGRVHPRPLSLGGHESTRVRVLHPGYVKVNTDGSWKGSAQAEEGAVIHTNEDCRVIPKDQVETDAEALQLMLSNAEAHVTHHLGALLEVSSLIKEDDNIKILRAKRNANVVVHKLAKYGAQMQIEREIHTDPPIIVLEAIENDKKTWLLMNKGGAQGNTEFPYAF